MFRKKKNKKYYFKNTRDFHRILIEKSIENKDNTKSMNCWLRFKNFFPRRKADKRAYSYSCYKQKKLGEIIDFISNSGAMFDSITDKISEIRVVEAFQSLCSTYVSLS
jgi:hypothetical protein